MVLHNPWNVFRQLADIHRHILNETVSRTTGEKSLKRSMLAKTTQITCSFCHRTLQSPFAARHIHGKCPSMTMGRLLRLSLKQHQLTAVTMTCLTLRKWVQTLFTKHFSNTTLYGFISPQTAQYKITHDH